jgi:hypothetical protein
LGAVRVLILTTFEQDEYVDQALRAGASGFLVKDTEPAELVQAVRVVARGDSLLSPGVTRRLIAEGTAHATLHQRQPASGSTARPVVHRGRSRTSLAAVKRGGAASAGRGHLHGSVGEQPDHATVLVHQAVVETAQGYQVCC